MASLSRTPDAYQIIQNYHLGEWNYSDVGAQTLRVYSALNVDSHPAYLVKLPSPSAVTDAGIEVLINRRPDDMVYSCRLVEALTYYVIDEQTYLKPAGGVAEKHTFSFSGLSMQTDSFYFEIRLLDYGTSYISEPKATATYTALPLTVGVTPSSLTAGGDVTLDFTNRLSQTLTINLRYESTQLVPAFDVSADSWVVNTATDWFEQAGISGNTMQVTAAVSDGLGRTASTNFTVNRPTGSTGTPTEPVSVAKSGSGQITFRWTYSGNGSQSGAELQWKTSSGDWQNLGTVNGAGTSYTAPAYKFPVGSIQWRVRVTNSYGIVGGWSSASFSVSYAALSVSASPASVYVNNQGTLSFTNRLGRTLLLEFRANGQALQPTWEVASDKVNFSPTADWFSTAGESGNTMQVTAAVSDELGRTASASFAAQKPTGSTATPTNPVNVTKDGTTRFTFDWTYSGDGTQSKAELQYKTASGDWTALATVNSSTQQYYATAYKFPVGAIQWRVRVRNSFGITGNWSSAASFTVSYAALSLAASPSTVYDMPAKIGQYNNTVTLGFTNRLGRLLRLQLKYNNNVIREIANINSDSVAVNMNGFFEEAEATGTSITVRAEVSDDLGRTANISFTCLKPQGSTATATAPKSTTVDGAGNINFAWTASSDWGSQTGAELQWSTDNAAWTDLASVDGSGQTWTAPAIQFPAGTIYWRVRVTNSFGLVGNWSSSVNFTVNYAAVSQVVPVNSQTSGIFARGAAKTFSARFEASGPVYSPFTFASATFKWRAGTSGDWTEVTMTSSDNGVTVSATIQANTFPQGVMQWMIEGTDNTGRTTETPVYTLTAATSVIDMTARRPVNTVESVNGEILFEIGFVSLDGETPPRGEWRWSSDGVEWETYATRLLNDRHEDYLKLTIPPDFFPAGTIYWQARGQNSAGVWGDWSTVVSFKALGAPVITGVTGDGKPFLTISWQTPAQSEYGQQAYKLEVDGQLYGPYFGADVRSYTLKEPLEDGAHMVRIAAQNRFGLWSEWATGNVNVTNVPGPSFTVFPYVGADGVPAPLVCMIGATIAPIITRQPQDYQRGTDGVANFVTGIKSWTNFNPVRLAVSVGWEFRTEAGETWQPYTGPTLAEIMAMPNETQANNGYQYRARAYNAVGEIYSDTATFYWREPAGYASELRVSEWRAPTGYFLIYRNGKLVGKTYENYFFDMPAIGKASYEVLQVLPDGYYTRGNVAAGYETVTVSVDAPTLISLDGKKVLSLTLSEDARRSQDIQRAREVAYTQYEGAVFPEAEIGEHESLSVSGDCAWTWEQKADADAFEALLGTPVIYKTPGGEMVVGVLDGFTQRDAHFYRTARFTIQQMDWRDYRDEP